VGLHTHRVVSTHHPSVELLVNDAVVATLGFELKVVFEIHGLAVGQPRGAA
jgi:hypothetical protein